jgi:Tannase and feruloyl esterase
MAARTFALPLLACLGVGLIANGSGAPATAQAQSGSGSRCSALAGLRLGELGRIVAAESCPAMLPPGPYGQPALNLPPHCEVTGIMQERTGRFGQHYAIRYHLRLPEAWNGRLLFQGGGGTNGDLGNAVGAANTAGPSALARGFAVVSQDSGHDNQLNTDPKWGGATVFGTDPQARANYGHASLPLVTAAAKSIVARFYSKPAAHSYFLGCSKGGQEGMAAAQRYPALFDGIVAGAPGFALPRAAINETFSVQQFAALAKAATGQSATVASIARTFSPSAMLTVRKAVLDACDAADGLIDGITADFRQCKALNVMAQLRKGQCTSGAADGCLSSAQIDTLGHVMAGPRRADGRPIYASWAWDGGIGSPMWSMWRVGNEQMPAFDIALGGASWPVVFSVPPSPISPAPEGILAKQLALNVNDMEAGIYRRSTLFPRSAWSDIGMHSANLDAFLARGGKLLVPHGVSDPVFSIMDTIGWYDRVSARYGAQTNSAVRVFAVPGMAHCLGGPGTTDFDVLASLVDWVEQKKAPDRIVATANGGTPWPGRTRPLCPWPKVARYRGGDPEAAESFACE